MAPRRKKPAKQARVKASAPKGSEPVPTCAFCDLPQGDDINGELLSSGSGLHVHYFCLLFSSGLHQRGEENEPLRGFVEADVRAELRRGSRLICCFCKRKNATVGCCLRACKKAFHMPCGVAKDCLLQFFGDFRVYCAAHRPRQNVVPMDRDGISLCAICSEQMTHPSVDVLVTPCCRQLFHRACIQRQAVSAGSHFFRCCHCNNQEAFQREMQDHGIYVPDQDASWEREPHAFEELLFRYQHCDAPRCSCPLGRSHHQEDGRWKMVVCDSCGSQGVHASCGNVGGSHWICTECRQIINRVPSAAQQSSSGRFEKHPSQQPEVIEIDSDDEDEAPRPQRHTERQTSSHAERVTTSGCRLLDFAMRGSSSDDSATLQLMLETISGSVIVADISLGDHTLIVS
uniref:G2/M phase-specific E3 ubiquitin-protein ligase n=1 Tax=Rhipicephalus zambeziensis TaxID=60191 RepID=A0A224YN25_9ACAR